MCFSSILWLMVIDCLSVFLFDFEYLCFCSGKESLLSTSPSFMYSSISLFPIFHIFLVLYPLFFNLPAPGLRAPSCTERISTHVVLYKWKIWRSWERRRWVCQFLPFPVLTRWRAGKVGIYVCPSALHFFVKLERNGIFLRYYICSLS